MILRLKELKKEGKVALIQAIANGLVDKRKLSQNSFICSKKEDSLMGLMLESGGCKVVFISEAKQTIDKALKNANDSELLE
jgi:hypothetical protein